MTIKKSKLTGRWAQSEAAAHVLCFNLSVSLHMAPYVPRIRAVLCAIPKPVQFLCWEEMFHRKLYWHLIFHCSGFNLPKTFQPNIFGVTYDRDTKAHLMCFQLGEGDLSGSQHNLIKWNLHGLVRKQLQGNTLVPPQTWLICNGWKLLSSCPAHRGNAGHKLRQRSACTTRWVLLCSRYNKHNTSSQKLRANIKD